jgi:hypothetical protein
MFIGGISVDLEGRGAGYMKKLMNLRGKMQLSHYLAQSRLLEYQSFQQEKLLRNGLSVSIQLPGITYQVTNMVNFLLMDHVRKTLTV